MTDEIPIADAIKAVRECIRWHEAIYHYPPPPPGLRAALDYLSERDNLKDQVEWERRQRDAARAELASEREISRNLSESVSKLDEALADARAEIERLHEPERKLRELMGDPRKSLHIPPADWGLPQNAAAPPLEDAMEAVREIREAFLHNLRPHFDNYGDLYPLNVARRLALEAIDAIIGQQSRALTAAREAERRKWQAATQPGVDPGGLRAYIEGREMAAQRGEREKYRALVEAAREAALQISRALNGDQQPTGCADDCTHPSHGHRR